MTREGVKIIAAFPALLIPVYWLPSIQSVDLPSHMYTAWLTLLVEKGQAPGLVVVSQWTNVMFDVILVELMRYLGSDWAARIAVSLAVLTFNAGFFLLLRRPERGYPWGLFPFQAMISYGWVYQAGLFNFYLSMGLSLIALSLLIRRPDFRRAAAGVFLLAVAVLAHALPVLWAAGTAAFIQLARRRRVKGRLVLTVAGISSIALLGWHIRVRFPTSTVPPAVVSVTGVDQLIVFHHGAYGVLALATLMLWGFVVWNRLERVHPLRALPSPFLLASILGSACVAAIPHHIWLPSYRQSLSLLPERMSLTVSILALGWIGQRRLPRWTPPAAAVLAFIYFAMLFADTSWAWRVEQKMTEIVRRLPQSSRVVSGLRVYSWRLDLTLHLIDRACLGWCFSYGNYEPSSHAFRLRAVAENPIVLAPQQDKVDMELGCYVVRERDLPMYQIILAHRGEPQLRIRPLTAGERVILTRLDGQPQEPHP